MFSHLGNFFSHYCCYRATTRYSIKFTFHECAPFKASLMNFEQLDALRDTKLIVSNETFYVNKAFLSSISPFFGRMFSSAFAEQVQVVHHLRDTSPYAFRDVIEALYNGDVPAFI
ncbi:hypothetical protein AAVH_20310 [Aphelenchoides avenae]|nr:hypothetical protein AAVH_20310 [Aphelenchus avenae]